MEKYIKYKRFEESLDKKDIQTFLDDLVVEGWDIIYYNEVVILDTYSGLIKINIVVVCGKKQNDIL
ncbi:MAG: hypothetical protein PF487_04575 [Bacteroidales bacterium]|jgi:hypothetical protein|nr:hypothetical protein [Bacteroidales bacterium]